MTSPCVEWSRFKNGFFLCLSLMLCATPKGANAYVVNITAGVRSLYLQVGVGLMTGGNGTFGGGATPGNNPTINEVSVSIASNAIGNGIQAMTTNSTVTNSAYDNFAFCTIPSQTYIAGLYRTPGAAANATLTVTTPINLSNGVGNSIPFNQISWVSGGSGDAVATVPSGTFAGGSTQTLLSIATNRWFESCLAFNYANANVLASGSYTGRAVYTLSAP
jgi:hypothetical protein